MILGKTLKYISFALITIVTINNIAGHSIKHDLSSRSVIAITPYDLIIANDLKTLAAIKRTKNNIYQFASSLVEIDKDISVIDIQNEYIKIKRKYIFTKDINAHLIECNITLTQNSTVIESCIYNEKIYNKLKEITQLLKNPDSKTIQTLLDKKNLQKKLIKSIYENLLTFQYYENYHKLYLGVNGIETQERSLETALNLLNNNFKIEDLEPIIVKDEIKDQNNYIISKIFQYDFITFSCETKVINKLVSLGAELRSKAPLNSPPISIDTICKDTIEPLNAELNSN
jgi:hypothetical protein